MKLALFTVLLALIVPQAESSSFFDGLFVFLFPPSDTTHTFISLLSTSQETPVCNQMGGLGNAIATYDTATKEFCYQLSYSGLSQAPVENASHIHAPGAIGATGPVLFTLAVGANKADCVQVTTDADEQSLLDGLWYFNVHTTACASGELRGQILKIS